MTTLVVVCAPGAAGPLQGALDILEMRGYEIARVETGDGGPTSALREQAQRCGTSALYLLAKSNEAQAPGVARLSAALRASGISAMHIVEVDVDWRDPMSMVGRVLDRARSLGAGGAPGRTLVPAADRKAGTIEIPPAPMPPKVARPTTSVAMPPPPPRAVAAAPAPVAAPTALAASLPFPAPVSAPSSAPIPTPVEPSVSAPLVEPSVDLRGSAATSDAAHDGGATWSPRVQPAPKWWARGRAWVSRARKQVVIGGAAVVGLAVIGSVGLAVASDDEATSPSSLASALDVPEVSTAQPRQAAPEEGDAAASEPTAADPSPPPTTPTPVAVVEPEEADAPPEPEPAPEPDPEPAVSSPEEIVVANGGAPRLSFDEAQAHCDAKSTDAATVRLASVGELYQLSGARRLPRGIYWTSTESDAFGPRALVWSTKKARAAPIVKGWRGAQALCVVEG